MQKFFLVIYEWGGKSQYTLHRTREDAEKRMNKVIQDKKDEEDSYGKWELLSPFIWINKKAKEQISIAEVALES